MSHQDNINRIKVVYSALGELGPHVVFVGGAVVSLYTDRPSAELRPTEDIDILVEVVNYNKYAQLEEKLREKGFINDEVSGVICRYRIHGIAVDVMPTDEQILGFANIWYRDGMVNAIAMNIGDNYNILIFSAPYFIAAKIEAFKARGKNDGRTSTDFEDIVFILNNRTTIWEEMRKADAVLKSYLQTEFNILHKSPYLSEWISCHLDYYEQGRASLIERSIFSFVII
jgi:hypothetical protein